MADVSKKCNVSLAVFFPATYLPDTATATFRDRESGSTHKLLSD